MVRENDDDCGGVTVDGPQRGDSEDLWIRIMRDREFVGGERIHKRRALLRPRFGGWVRVDLFRWSEANSRNADDTRRLWRVYRFQGKQADRGLCRGVCK